MMPRALLFSIATTDLGFVVYWAVSALYAAGLVEIPPDVLFADYHDARAIAWNWSFLPLDLAVTGFGLWALAASRNQDSWRMPAAISLALCSTAGGMAIGYWALLRDFDPAWFLPNLLLFVWPLIFLPGLFCGTARTPHRNQLSEGI